MIKKFNEYINESKPSNWEKQMFNEINPYYQAARKAKVKGLTLVIGNN